MSWERASHVAGFLIVPTFACALMFHWLWVVAVGLWASAWYANGRAIKEERKP